MILPNFFNGAKNQDLVDFSNDLFIQLIYLILSNLVRPVVHIMDSVLSNSSCFFFILSFIQLGACVRRKNRAIDVREVLTKIILMTLSDLLVCSFIQSFNQNGRFVKVEFLIR